MVDIKDILTWAPKYFDCSTLYKVNKVNEYLVNFERDQRLQSFQKIQEVPKTLQDLINLYYNERTDIRWHNLNKLAESLGIKYFTNKIKIIDFVQYDIKLTPSWNSDFELYQQDKKWATYKTEKYVVKKLHKGEIVDDIEMKIEEDIVKERVYKAWYTNGILSEWELWTHTPMAEYYKCQANMDISIETNTWTVNHNNDLLIYLKDGSCIFHQMIHPSDSEKKVFKCRWPKDDILCFDNACRLPDYLLKQYNKLIDIKNINDKSLLDSYILNLSRIDTWLNVEDKELEYQIDVDEFEPYNIDTDSISCDICGCKKSNSRLADLRRHFKIHQITEDKTYKCDECTYSTNHKYNLTGHKKVHLKKEENDSLSGRDNSPLRGVPEKAEPSPPQKTGP